MASKKAAPAPQEFTWQEVLGMSSAHPMISDGRHEIEHGEGDKAKVMSVLYKLGTETRFKLARNQRKLAVAMEDYNKVIKQIINTITKTEKDEKGSDEIRIEKTDPEEIKVAKRALIKQVRDQQSEVNKTKVALELETFTQADFNVGLAEEGKSPIEGSVLMLMAPVISDF